MTTSAIAWAQTWGEITADIKLNWFIYLSMPLVAAFVGYTTKLVALQMLYRPIEFVGIGPIGWQGVVPRRAGKTAALTIQMLTDKLLRPEEILDKIDAKQAVDDLREPLTRTIDAMARELAEQVRPGLWDSIPAAGRNAVLSRMQAAAPEVVDNLLTEMKTDLPRFIDLQYLAVTILVKNKTQLNELMQGMGGAAMKFIRRSGIYFGFAIGLVQMVAWGLFHNPWIMPGFGFVTGFASDWLALNLIFIPRKPMKLFGVIPAHGVLHAERDNVTRDYARILANDLFSPDVLLEAILHGPTAERLFAAIEKEVSAAVDAQVGMAQPLLTLAIGTKRYRQAKDAIIAMLLERLPETMEEAKEYTAKTLDIENLIVDKMNKLSPDQYEAILRPVFKDDEMLMVMVGAVLGFLVGELQVVLVEQFAR
ncbi:hypothetical protein A5707_07130 [Mycobacterium kyorinense]|uniref:DUF445 domain-containing protein n=1 Tax=Mycobacterium kyorinense TaxID=487514 RepID=A0A1A2YTH1_9MYCO|nr:hypothetical protein [Mycobacterium kyorinense]OBI41549.1 hypothetical protein A5707_07130 [Mycobacterium kyorinense]